MVEPVVPVVPVGPVEPVEPVTSVEPGGSAQPVPSLADAWVLLLRSAAAHLRGLRPAARPGRVPTAARVPAAVRAPRRRMARRDVLTCLLLLLAIFGATAGMTWWSWQTLQDRQVHLGGAQDLRAAPDGRSLTEELVNRREDRTLEAAPAKQKPGSTVLERPDAGVSGQSGGNVSLDGRIVAGALIAAALGGATLLSRLVLRRYRRRALLPPPRLDPPWTLEPEIPVAPLPEELRAPEVLPELPAEDAVVPTLDPGPGEGGSRTDLFVEQRQPLPEESLRTGLTPDPAALSSAGSLSQDLAGGYAPRQVERLDLSGTASATWAGTSRDPADAASYDATVEEAARERIFDRRASRRLPYVQPAWLWWADQNAPVTVQDIGLTGLRCVLSVSPGAPALQAPPLGDVVRIFFPAGGSTVKAAARLQWKEQTPQGMQLGLEFVDLPQADAERVHQLLLGEG